LASSLLSAGLALLASQSSFAQPAPPIPDTCIAFITTNLAKGNGNWFTYYRFADKRLAVKPGDTLIYRILLDPRNPEAKGGVDADFEDNGEALRDLGLRDDHGLRVHGDGDLTTARGQWLTRKIDLSSAKGRIITAWTLNEEGDKNGRYAQFIDDVTVAHSDGFTTIIYENGAPPSRELLGNTGYTTQPVCVAIDSSRVKQGANFDEIIKASENLAKRSKALDDIRREVNLSRQFADRDSDSHMRGHVDEAASAIAKAERESASPEEIEAALHSARAALGHTHPMMGQYTGHLVGHAHIDLQWLWEWQEGIVFTRDTFAQAVKFMDEFPGFTFSQSSSCLYQAMEEHYPELFTAIQAKVKADQWELVGGRVCEADTNMISEESSVRQFLYGQRYFREKFGKTAVVGWEPDTFGHTIQMPQMLRLSGCEFYYFCRAGKKLPLFWWEGLDSSRVLAFDEPATGSWYNADLSYKQFQEMLDFNKVTGSKDMLWVYGVGNHGGGPTREHIQWALEQQKNGSNPAIRFSTATEFFTKLATYDLSKIPVVKEELNPVFDGCYTTHSEVKQLNRNAEALTTTAEAVATVASLRGFAYPRAAFRRNWEDICFNHHHDTLPGSGIHAPYAKTRTMLERVIADDRDIITRAMESMVVQVKPQGPGVSVMVFNPNGWARSGWIETYLVKSGWDHDEVPDPKHALAAAPDGSTHPVRLISGPSRKVRFWAANIPAFGYRVFHFVGGEPAAPNLEIRDGGAVMETATLVVEFDREQGCIKRLFDKQSGKEMCGAALGRLEAHWEKPQGMSAWVLGEIAKVDPLTPTSVSFSRGVDFAEATVKYTLPAWNDSGGESFITQRFHVPAEGSQITCDVDCQWNGVGTSKTPNAMLRIAFDVAAVAPVATYHVPFGALSRPADGREFPALQWVDLSNAASGGIAIFNDCKHGFAAKGASLTMSLIRSSFDPDPVPNPGNHQWRYAILPHAGDWRTPDLAKAAAEFNQPMIAATIPFDATGPAPLEWSLFATPPHAAIATTLKRAEDGDGLILRMYEARGNATDAALTFTKGVGLGEGMSEGITIVNFIEDTAPAAEKPANPLNLRPFEIKTLKIRTQPKNPTPPK